MKIWEYNAIVEFADSIQNDLCPTHAAKAGHEEMRRWTDNFTTVEMSEVLDVEAILDCLRKMVIYVKNQTVVELMECLEEQKIPTGKEAIQV